MSRVRLPECQLMKTINPEILVPDPSGSCHLWSALMSQTVGWECHICQAKRHSPREWNSSTNLLLLRSSSHIAISAPIEFWSHLRSALEAPVAAPSGLQLPLSPTEAAVRSPNVLPPPCAQVHWFNWTSECHQQKQVGTRSSSVFLRYVLAIVLERFQHQQSISRRFQKG